MGEGTCENFSCYMGMKIYTKHGEQGTRVPTSAASFRLPGTANPDPAGHLIHKADRAGCLPLPHTGPGLVLASHGMSHT